MGNNLNKKTLPEELIVEILLKLTVKSLLRCRCFSKFWYNFIKNPNFINLHLLNNQNSNYIILIRRLFDSSTTLTFHDYQSLDVISPDLELPLVVHKNSLDVSGPCNGLICISDCLNTIVLCNPSSRAFRSIPPPAFTCPEGYDPSFKIKSIGFGFDPNMNAYKVVSFICLSPFSDHPWYKLNKPGGPLYLVPDVYICVIYNLGTNTWREIDHEREMNMRYIVPFSPGVLLNEAFHWIAVGYDAGENNSFIFHFNMSTELFGYMNLPFVDPEEDKCERLIIFDDSLALFSYTNPWEAPEQQFVDIWVMKQYGVKESWTKQFTIGPVTGIERPLLVWKNEAVLMESTEGFEEGVEAELVSELVSCGFDNSEIDAYQMYGFRNTFKVLVNHESLVSI